MSLLAQIVIALAIFAAGAAGGIKWELGVQARAELAVAEVRATDARRQIRVGDQAAANHASELAIINNKLGDARAQIATLSGRECLSAGTVGMLNAIGDQPVPAAAGQPAGETAATAAGTGIRFSTDRDTASAIAVCRARYAEVSDQLNQVLDIEDARYSP